LKSEIMRATFHALGIFFCLSSVAEANALRVAPTLLDVNAPGATTTVNLRNDGDQNLHVQIRIFRWTDTQSEPTLVPTNDVVISPPAATMTPGTEYVVRVVRVSKQPVVGEESYRILVDEVPDATADRPNSVRFALRYSIPVFFQAASVPAANVSWSMTTRGKTTVLVAENSGGRRARLSNLKLIDAHGETLLHRPGLVGYALGKTAVSWTIPKGERIGLQGPLRVTAESETGVINATVASQPSR
jgi:fimbrial chaperone protein